MTKVEIESKADKVELENEADKKAELYANELANRRLFEKPTPYIVGLEEGYSDGYIAGAESREKRIEELKQENIELQKGLSVLNASNSFNKEQLTKAKDHIKTLLDCLKQDTNDPQTNYYVCQYMDKAEQFMKEI